MPTGCKSVYLAQSQHPVSMPARALAPLPAKLYLLVISNVVPKICARTNSAILNVCPIQNIAV